MITRRRNATSSKRLTCSRRPAGGVIVIASRDAARLRLWTVLFGATFLVSGNLRAQDGDTPTGLAGGFGGSIETGAGSFDPYERNSSRSVTDIVVPGAVLPFTYTRIWNSRSRGWKTNWSWAIKKLSVTEVANCDPANRNCFFYGYSISFPDGREIQFNKPTNAAEGEPGNYPAVPGALERFVIMPDRAHAQLILVDGSVVNWTMSCATFCGFSLASVVDPYLRAVTFT